MCMSKLNMPAAMVTGVHEEKKVSASTGQSAVRSSSLTEVGLLVKLILETTQQPVDAVHCEARKKRSPEAAGVVSPVPKEQRPLVMSQLPGYLVAEASAMEPSALIVSCPLASVPNCLNAPVEARAYCHPVQLPEGPHLPGCFPP